MLFRFLCYLDFYYSNERVFIKYIIYLLDCNGKIFSRIFFLYSNLVEGVDYDYIFACLYEELLDHVQKSKLLF